MTVTTSPTPPWPESGTLFGLDLSCVEDIEAEGDTVAGRLGIAQAVARRLITPQGTLVPAGEGDTASALYGFDLRQFFNADLGPRELAEIAAGVEDQARAEEAVFSAKATVELMASGELSVILDLQDRVGPFRAVVAVGEVDISLLTLGA